MEINITLLIQAVHFFIAYILLRIFLLKPVYTEIEKEKNQEDVLIGAIEKKRDIIEDKKEKKQEQWVQCQKYFLQKAPWVSNPEIYIFKAITKAPTIATIPREVITQRAYELEKELIKKVEHVD